MNIVVFHLKSRIFRRSQTGAGFVIDMAQIFRMGNGTLENERLEESASSAERFSFSAELSLFCVALQALSRRYR